MELHGAGPGPARPSERCDLGRSLYLGGHRLLPVSLRESPKRWEPRTHRPGTRRPSLMSTSVPASLAPVSGYCNSSQKEGV